MTHNSLPSMMIVLLVGMASMTLGGLPLVPEAKGTKLTLALIGFFEAWNFTTHPNPTIVAAAGQAVTITLTSGDGLPHRFFIDVDESGFIPDCHPDKCSKFFGGTSNPTTTFHFKANLAAMTYAYYCSVHPLSMVGALTITG